jgi:hypothetical protein
MKSNGIYNSWELNTTLKINHDDDDDDDGLRHPLTIPNNLHNRIGDCSVTEQPLEPNNLTISPARKSDVHSSALCFEGSSFCCRGVYTINTPGFDFTNSKTLPFL